MRHWLGIKAIERASRSMPHSEIESERSRKDIWSCKLGRSKAIWLFISIINVLAAFIGKYDGNTLRAPL